MTNDVRGNFFLHVWNVFSNDETIQIMTYIEVCMILMIAM
jgi:cytochrome bd-type quinol oxidase subunit 2